VAGELEVRWNKALSLIAEVEAKIAALQTGRPMPGIDPTALATLATDLKSSGQHPPQTRG
jgi:hypothetical protein